MCSDTIGHVEGGVAMGLKYIQMWGSPGDTNYKSGHVKNKAICHSGEKLFDNIKTK